jgi:hypothetical protein
MRKLLSVIVLGLLVVACGTKQPASPLDVLPETGVLQIAISDPASIVANIDGYIATGVPIAGPNLVMSQILAATDAENVDSLASWLGIDVHGTVALYMVGVNPQTIGLAAAVSNPEAFWTRTTEWGAEWTDAEPIGTAVVKTLTTGQVTANVAIYRGCILAAASRAELTTMIDRIEGRAPRATVAVQPGTIWLKADVSTFGPMAAGQLAMYRPQIMSQIEYSGADQMGNEQMASAMIGLYFDMIDKVLRETKTVEYTLTVGPENFGTLATVVWTEGSSIAASLIPVEATDYTGMIPSAGAVVAGRVSLPPELSRAAMASVFTALGTSPDQAYIDLIAEMSRNTAFAMYDDDLGPMHMVAVYEMPEGSDMSAVRSWIDGSLGFAREMLGTMPGLVFTSPKDSVIAGVSYLTYSTTMDLSAMQGATVSATAIAAPMTFPVWLTQKDNLLLLELAPRPFILPQILAGTVAEPLSGVDYFAASGADKEITIGMELAGYTRMFMKWAGPEAAMLDLSAVTGQPAWVWSDVDVTEGGMTSSCICKGAEVASYIGGFATAFGTAAGAAATAPAPVAPIQ